MMSNSNTNAKVENDDGEDAHYNDITNELYQLWEREKDEFIKTYLKVNVDNKISVMMEDTKCNLSNILNDEYCEETLITRYNNFKNTYMNDETFIKGGLKIRHQNTPEDITENITKFIIRNYENDTSCVWCKGVDKKYGLIGDLYSSKYDKTMPIEVKSFTSSGPSQFGPNKKFGVLYFLDLKKWLNNEIILWKVNLNYLSDEFKSIKVNKTQTMGQQLLEGRRPHISWSNIYPQISDFCEKIYEGTFENIFSNAPTINTL